jgi:sporulation protein YlmC with PRC-barrel domain
MGVYYDFVPAPEVTSDRVKGITVYDHSGNRVGRVRRLLIDKQSGRVSSLQVVTSGLLGFGTHRYTIPWDNVAYDTELDGYRADAPK